MFGSARDTSLNESLRRAIGGETVRIEGSYTSTTGNRSSVHSWHFQPVLIDDEGPSSSASLRTSAPASWPKRTSSTSPTTTH